MVEKKRRPPGWLPDLVALPSDRERFATIQRVLQALLDGYSGRPAPHASTHKGGSDDVAGTTEPSAITPGMSGAIGDATAGFAPIGHIHDTTDLDFLATLNEVGTMTLNGSDVAFVYDERLNRLLEAILLELIALNEESE